MACSEGDQIAEGDTVVEVSTDKVDAEVPAPASGTITKILVGPDETVEVGKPLAEMAKGEAPAATARQRKVAKPERPRRYGRARAPEERRECLRTWAVVAKPCKRAMMPRHTRSPPGRCRRTASI